MEKQRIVIPPKPVSIQTRLALSMVYQVKDKLKIERWMQPRDVVEANPMIFDRIRKAIEQDYDYPYIVDNGWRAVELFLKGVDCDGVH